MGNYLITMPDVGEGTAEVEIIEWNVTVDQQIKEDDLLCTVMTDKANVEIPSPVDGTVTWLGAAVGDVVAVGADFVRLQVDGAGNTSNDIAATSPATTPSETASSQQMPATMPEDSSPGVGNYLITMPDVGEGTAEVEIIEWNVAVGQQIEEDDLLCTVMTDKANVEIPSPVDGTVTWLGAAVGDVVAVGADFVRLQVADAGNAGGDIATTTAAEGVSTQPVPATKPDPLSPKTSPGAEAAKPEPVAQATQVSPATAMRQPVAAAPRPEGEKPIASPAVRQRARNAGVDLRYVRGSGPAGRITHEDLNDFIAGNSAPLAAYSDRPVAETSVKEIKVMGLRRRIAAIMQDTMQRIPHFTYVEEIDVTELELVRAKLNRERRDDQPKLTMLPFFIKALVKALRVYPEMGSRFDDEAEVVYQYGAAHIGIATQTENGLVVPVVRHAETMDIWQSADEIKRLSTIARAGKASREELSGSTITISSLGPMGGITTTPVINSPEVAILGVNKVAKRPVWQHGHFVPRDIMNLSSSFDHRIIDGWEATLFIQHIKGLLETPVSLFMED